MKKKKIGCLISLLLVITIIFYEALMPGHVSSNHSERVKNFIVEVTDIFRNNAKKEKTEEQTFIINYAKDDLEVTFSQTLVLEEENAVDLGYLIRKSIGHFGVFFLLGIIGLICFSMYVKNNKIAFGSSLVLGLAVAVISELLQLIPEGRCCTVQDMALDFSGYLLGSIIVFSIYHFSGKWKNQNSEMKGSN